MDKKTVVGLLHGYMGSARQFSVLTEKLRAGGVETRTLTLPGHDATMTEFAAAGPKQWLQSAYDFTSELTTQYESVILVGHSMGGLLALLAAKRNAGQVRRVVAVAPPVFLRLTPAGLLTRLRTLRPPSENEPEAVAAARRFSGIPWLCPANVWRVLPSTFSLLRIMRLARSVLPGTEVTLSVFPCENDEIVSPRSAPWLLRRIPGSLCFSLRGASHFGISDDHWDAVAREALREADPEQTSPCPLPYHGKRQSI